MRSKIVSIVILFFSGLMISCNETLYIPISNDTSEQSKLIAGRTLYVQKCSSCHNLYLPERFSDEKWDKKLDTMQVRAKIDNSERQLIYHYIISHPQKAKVDSTKK